MSRRTTRPASPLFRDVLTQAEQRLFLDYQQAANFQHSGVRGDERADTLTEFLRAHLPSVFGVGKGEARDFRDNVTGQLDVFVYGQLTVAPIHGGNNLIVPAEALYAVIEVKSVLNQDELDICLRAAKKVRSLRPFKKQFIPSPIDGRVEKNHYRCPYFIFTYSSNLSEDGWAAKEYQRMINGVQHVDGTANLIDRLIVMNRGIIEPQARKTLLKEDSQNLFLEFYLHLMNFLMRELKRRPAIDWAAYGSASRWTRLD
jgi:hypothetical protein